MIQNYYYYNNNTNLLYFIDIIKVAIIEIKYFAAYIFKLSLKSYVWKKCRILNFVQFIDSNLYCLCHLNAHGNS